MATLRADHYASMARFPGRTLAAWDGRDRGCVTPAKARPQARRSGTTALPRAGVLFGEGVRPVAGGAQAAAGEDHLDDVEAVDDGRAGDLAQVLVRGTDDVAAFFGADGGGGAETAEAMAGLDLDETEHVAIARHQVDLGRAAVVVTHEEIEAEGTEEAGGDGFAAPAERQVPGAGTPEQGRRERRRGAFGGGAGRRTAFAWGAGVLGGWSDGHGRVGKGTEWGGQQPSTFNVQR